MIDHCSRYRLQRTTCCQQAGEFVTGLALLSYNSRFAGPAIAGRYIRATSDNGFVNYSAVNDGACREHPSSQVDQGKRTPTRYVCHRSLRPTPVCFLSTGHWKTGITLAKGKAPKVSVAAQAGADGRHSRGERGFGLRHQTRKGDYWKTIWLFLYSTDRRTH